MQEHIERLERLGLPVRVSNMTSVWTTLYTQPSRYNWMFQYYLRAEGLVMSWVGTGRFIFSHDISDSDFEEITRRFVKAAQEMDGDGWWWNDGRLTNRAIKRRVIKEILSSTLRNLGRVPLDRTTDRAEARSAPCDTSSHRETGPSESW